MKTFKLVVNNQRGAVAVIVGITLAVLLSFLALAIDVGYIYATKNELQNAADSAALAAAGKLGNLYSLSIDPTTFVCNRSDILPVAQAVVGSGKNKAGGSDISIRDADIFINNIDNAGTKFSTNDYNQPDAVRVIARRDSILNSQIATFFAQIFGVDSVPVVADATAALTGQSTMAEGGLPLPVAINKSWMDTKPCNQDLTFHPSSAGTCSAWHAYDDTPYQTDPEKDYDPNGNDMRDMIDAIREDTYNSPETIAGETTYEFTNGTLASLFTHSTIQDLFNVMKGKNDFIDDYDTDPDTWTTTVPIFDDTVAGCSPNQELVIEGFTSITITEVTPPPETTIYATVTCGLVEPGRGGGGNYGTKGSIPGLVE